MQFAKIALRNLSRQKKRSFLIAGAIALGVFIILTVNALTAGSVRILKENVADLMGGHIFVEFEKKLEDKTISYIEDDTKLFEAVEKMGLPKSSVSRSVQMMGTAIYAGKTAMQQVIGLDWAQDDKEFEKLGMNGTQVAAMRKEAHGLVLSKRTAKNLNLQLGDSVVVRMSTISGQSNVGDFIIAHITEDDSDTMSFVAFAHQAYVAELLDLPTNTSYSTFQVRVESLDVAPLYAEQMKLILAETYEMKDKNTSGFSFGSRVRKKTADQGEWEGIRVDLTTVNDMLAPINMVVNGIMGISYTVFVILMLITVIGVINTFRMILFERIREIGTMRALGMQKPNVRSMMLYEALFLSILGYLVGFVLSIIVEFFLSLPSFGTDSIFSILLHNGHFYFLTEIPTLLTVFFIVTGFTMVAAFFPARKAARLEPATALRTAN